MSDAALKMATQWIASFEGFRSEPYLDGGGVPTIGYGCTCLPTGARVTMDTPAMTQDAALATLRLQVSRVMASVLAMVHVPVTDHQAASLCSLAYNVGTGALRSSTLMRLLNSGNTTGAAGQFGAWVYSNGHVVPGLVHRRKSERDLFLTPDIPHG